MPSVKGQTFYLCLYVLTNKLHNSMNVWIYITNSHEIEHKGRHISLLDYFQERAKKKKTWTRRDNGNICSWLGD